MARRKTTEDYHALAKERGFRWLGPAVPNVRTKTLWECAQGHQWQARYTNIKKGTGCPVCAGNVPKTPADYHTLAERRGFQWLGPEVPNVRTKTGWECGQGHQWEAVYSNIRRGSGCPVCARKVRTYKRRKTPDDYHALAERRGFRWLGPEAFNVHARTIWECDQGHRWETAYSTVQRGSGCPFCAGVAPRTPDDYRVLAKQRGFRWLGIEVENTHTRTPWECNQGHRWDASYSSIQQGDGCPACAGNVPKTLDDYHALAEQRGFRWLGDEVGDIRTKTPWECDQGHRWEACYKDIRQGSGCPVCASKRSKTSADYHALAAERGFRWLGPEVSRTNIKTGWECARGHRWEARYGSIQQGTGCPACAGLAPKTPGDYQDLAEARGFRWLGPTVPNTKTKTGWECGRGHRWENTYDRIRQGKGCPVCAGNVSKTPDDSLAPALHKPQGR